MTEWTAERVDNLRRYWDEGYTCLTISQIFTKEYSTRYTRNSIVGKVRRLHLSSRIKKKPPVTVSEVIKQVPKTKARKRIHLSEEYYNDEFFTEAINYLTPQSSDITNIPGNGQCKYIIGDVYSHNGKWCREPTRLGESWCPCHKKLVYYPPRSASVK